LTTAVDFVISDAGEKVAALGIDPKLIVVLETGPTPTVDDEQNWTNAGLRIVDSRGNKKVVAFGSDPEMSKFVERLQSYASGPSGKQKSAPYSSFFDGIDTIRPYGPQDRLGRQLAKSLDEDGASDFLVDVEVWYPGDLDVASSWVAEIRAGIVAGGGSFLDSFVSPAVGVVLLRLRLSRAVLDELLKVDLIATVELVAGRLPVNAAPSEFSSDDIGDLPVPAPDAPLVGVIDSGVVSEHPLLKGCVVETVSLSDWLSDGVDRTGHGTAVACLIARGSIEEQLAEGEWEIPPCRILSVRVLDDRNELPEHRLIENELADAVRYLAEHGVRVINFSIGDLDAAYDGNKAPVLAALLDELARKYNVVFVVPTGTVYPADYALAYDEQFSLNYARELASSSTTRVIDPGPSALALTVGGAVQQQRVLPLGLRSLGSPGWPAPFSRVGEGISGAVKPELVAAAGTLAQDLNSWDLREADEAKVVVADGRPDARGIITYDVGSSFAVPIVARIGGALQNAYPEASANLLRALILQSAEASPDFLEGHVDLSDSDKATLLRRATGYGTASMVHSLTSEPQDVVLYAEDEIDVDDVHLFALPIPQAFFTRRRLERGISVSLCYDPPVRARRLDYLGSRMSFEMVRGVTADEALKLFLDEKSSGHIQAPVSRLSAMSPTKRIGFSPSTTARSRGVNQLGRYVWRQSLPAVEKNGNEFLLAVQNTRRWAAPRSKQYYALAVRFWVAEHLPPIYAEIRNRVPRVRVRERVR
jgi:subtilisin family serine protease